MGCTTFGRLLRGFSCGGDSGSMMLLRLGAAFQVFVGTLQRSIPLAHPETKGTNKGEPDVVRQPTREGVSKPSFDPTGIVRPDTVGEAYATSNIPPARTGINIMKHEIVVEVVKHEE